MDSHMKAAQLIRFGLPCAVGLRDVRTPEPGVGEVAVDLRAAALNRRDLWLCGQPDYCRLPVTLGSDGAGVVASLGGGVEGVAVGDQVVINPTLGWGPAEDAPGPDFDILGAPLDGTFAERVIVPAASVAPRPVRLGWHEAAALSLGGLTAWRAVSACARAGAGSTLLVTGASGGVATFAIQIASALGARVLITTSSEEKIGRAGALGAMAGFLYQDPEWPDAVLKVAPGGVDAVIDSSGGGSWRGCLKVLRQGGRLVSYGDTAPGLAQIDVSDIYWCWRSIVGTSMGSPRDFQALLAHVNGAKWSPVVDSVFSLEQTSDAFSRLQAPDRVGKVVLSIE